MAQEQNELLQLPVSESLQPAARGPANNPRREILKGKVEPENPNVGTDEDWHEFTIYLRLPDGPAPIDILYGLQQRLNGHIGKLDSDFFIFYDGDLFPQRIKAVKEIAERQRSIMERDRPGA